MKINNSKIIILVTTFTKRVIAVLDMPKDIDDFLTFAKGIQSSMAGSSYFAGLAAKITVLEGNITLLDTAETGTKSKPPTVTTAARDIELNKVQNNLRGLQSDVQELADAAANTDIAEDIIISAGMKVKKQGAINKQDLEVKDGPVSGTVTAVAKGPEKKPAAHDWGYSKDDGVTWVHLDPTLVVTTDITSGIEVGDSIQVRHRYIYVDGPTSYVTSEPFIVR